MTTVAHRKTLLCTAPLQVGTSPGSGAVPSEEFAPFRKLRCVARAKVHPKKVSAARSSILAAHQFWSLQDRITSLGFPSRSAQ